MKKKMNFKEVQDFVKSLSKMGVSEINIKTDELKLSVKYSPKKKDIKNLENTTFVQQMPFPNQMTSIPQFPIASSPPQEKKLVEEKKVDVVEKKENLISIKASMVGTFYRKPSPDKPDYISIGDNVKVGDTVCIIEAMKLFNEIESEISGKLVKVLVKDATPVEFGQKLFLLEKNL